MMFEDIIWDIFQGKRVKRAAWDNKYIQLFNTSYVHFGPNPGDLVFSEAVLLLIDALNQSFNRYSLPSVDFQANDWIVVD